VSNSTPPIDQYFKGALFLNTLRSVVDNDPAGGHSCMASTSTSNTRTIMTEDVVEYFNQQTGMNLTPIFHEYLRHAALPVLECKWSPGGNVHYRWQADESTFAMPVLVGTPGALAENQAYEPLANDADSTLERPVPGSDRPVLHQGSMDAVTIELSPIAARVLGSLVEKEITYDARVLPSFSERAGERLQPEKTTASR